MNGHCDFHVFESAVDVCELCFADLCRTCALSLKGRKDTVCKECALSVSGVRGAGRPQTRGDRQTVKERRRTYAEAEPPDDFFRYFDAELPDDALTPGAHLTSDPDPGTGTGSDEGNGIRRLFGRRKTDHPDPIEEDFVAIGEILRDSEPGAGEDDADLSRDADAVSQLADIRRRSEDGDEPPIDSEPDPGLDIDGAVPMPSTLLQAFDDAEIDKVDKDEVDEAGDGRAVADLPDPDNAVQADEPTDDEAAVDVQPDQPEGEAVSVLRPSDFDNLFTDDEDRSGSTGNPFRKTSVADGDPDAVPDFSTDPFTDTGPSAEPAVERRRKDDVPAGRPAPGSTVLPTVAKRSETRDTETQDTETRDTQAQDSDGWTAIDDVPDLDGSTPRQRADIDARGSWIPPALRGSADDAADAGEKLPRRRP